MLSTLVCTLLFLLLLSSASHSAREKLSFNPKDPKMNDIKTVNTMLNTYIAKKDRNNVERLMAYTQEQVSKYTLLIMIEFYENLSVDKLEKLRQSSPERWKTFEMHLNKTLVWLSLTKRADGFLGGHLEEALKEELGEKQGNMRKY